MRKLTKRFTFYLGLIIAAVAVFLTTLAFKKVDLEETDNRVAVIILRDLSDLDQRLQEQIFEARAFRLENYDAFVKLTNDLSQTCPTIEGFRHAMFLDDNKDLQSNFKTFCSLAAETIGLIESFKTKNSLLGNTIKYFPSLIEGISSTEYRNEALDLYSDILLFCLHPTEEVAARMTMRLTKLEKRVRNSHRDYKNLAAFQKHAGLVIKTATEREQLTSTIFAPAFRTSVKKVVDGYTIAKDAHDRKSQVVKVCAMGASGILLICLLVLLYRLQVSVNSLAELNKTLEGKVSLRTKALESALDELSRQQQIIAHSTKMSALGEMAGGIAHEINTPLAAISLRAESLMMTETFSDETTNGLNEIISIVNRIGKIVTGLRKFSRNDQDVPMSSADLKSIVSETVTFCSQKFLSHGVALQIDVAEKLSVNCVPEQISQVLLNLLNNAFDAIQEIEVKWIRIESSIEDSFAVLRIVDCGHGIPESIQQKLMQPFFTTKGVGKGTGIGLSISRGIVQKHGGSFRYDPAQANTTFEIKLPLSEAALPKVG